MFSFFLQLVIKILKLISVMHPHILRSPHNATPLSRCYQSSVQECEQVLNNERATLFYCSAKYYSFSNECNKKTKIWSIQYMSSFEIVGCGTIDQTQEVWVDKGVTNWEHRSRHRTRFLLHYESPAERRLRFGCSCEPVKKTKQNTKCTVLAVFSFI